jgi:hypothetical protein
VQPIFQQFCGGCHSVGGMAGMTDFPYSYASSQAVVTVADTNGDCAATDTIGTCTLKLIKAGFMPYFAGCTGNPANDASNASCLTAAEQATIQAWITDGEQP